MARRLPKLSFHVDLERIVRNTQAIVDAVDVAVLAVVKANAYGLGIEAVSAAIQHLVHGFCVFSLREVVDLSRPPEDLIILGPPQSDDPADYIRYHAQPAVSALHDAAALAKAHPVLSIDTGMQRFTCPAGEVEAILKAGYCPEAMTHATRPKHVARLLDIVGDHRDELNLHAAASGLLHDRSCWLNAVRPGMALYIGAARVSTPLVEVRDGHGPAGYTEFVAPRHGIIIMGYTQGLRPGPCRINGRSSRVLEVGMQTAFVEAEPGDRVGDEVVLLGDGLEASEIAPSWGVSSQEVLVRLMSSRDRE